MGRSHPLFQSKEVIEAMKDPFDMEKKQTEELTLLGASKTDYPKSPEEAVLETFVNKHQDVDYVVEFECPEFTSLCPRTGQPDFARISIAYVPRVKMIESKALKLFLFSFRNHGEFHEDCVNRIAKRLFEAMDPKIIAVRGDFYPRGGISINPTVILPDYPPQHLMDKILDFWQFTKAT